MPGQSGEIVFRPLVTKIVLQQSSLVEHARANGLWIRFYTLDGATKDELSCHGWFRNYKFWVTRGRATALARRSECRR
jgi:hypothetical protein